MNKFDMMSKDALSRVEEIMNATKLNEFLHRKEEEEKQKNCILWILAIIGIVAAVADGELNAVITGAHLLHRTVAAVAAGHVEVVQRVVVFRVARVASIYQTTDCG